MADMDKIHREARALRYNEAFTLAMEMLRQDAINQFKSSAPDDPETRTMAWYLNSSVDIIETQIKQWAEQTD